MPPSKKVAKKKATKKKVAKKKKTVTVTFTETLVPLAEHTGVGWKALALPNVRTGKRQVSFFESDYGTYRDVVVPTKTLAILVAGEASYLGPVPGYGGETLLYVPKQYLSFRCKKLLGAKVVALENFVRKHHDKPIRAAKKAKK